MMDLNELRSLLQELLQAVQLAISSGEMLSDELMGQVANTIELLYSQIEALTAQGAAQIPQSTPRNNIPSSGPSSNIAGMQYDDKNGDLLIQFLGKYPNRNGPIYKYDNVPPVIVELLQSGSIPARTKGKNKWGEWWPGKVPSLGSSAHTLITSQNYPYQRVG